MNIKLIALTTTFLFAAYNSQASICMHQSMRGEMIQASLNSPKLTIREQLKFHQERIHSTAIEKEFESKYSEVSPEIYKNLDLQKKIDYHVMLHDIMQIRFINRIFICMDAQPSNTAKKCFCIQSLEASKDLEDILKTELVGKEFHDIHLAIFESIQQKVAQIIFNPENNQE